MNMIILPVNDIVYLAITSQVDTVQKLNSLRTYQAE